MSNDLKTGIKIKIKKVIQFLLNPKLLLCFGVAWMITNGWSYIMLGVGTFMRIPWMIAVSGAYLAFLWLPISPEKILTVIIAIGLLQFFFPKDEKTLGVLKDLLARLKGALKNRKEKNARKRANRKARDK